jgi:hypothetical protein
MALYAYRINEKNKDELIELYVGTSVPTGKIYRKVLLNEPTGNKIVIVVKDNLTQQNVTYVLDKII